MAQLLLRSEPIGEPNQPIRAVLFDKDGTLSISEPMLHALASARVFHARLLLQQRHSDLPPGSADALADLLQRAYGLSDHSIHPAGATAVGSRAHNLLSTATALAQIGLGWPEALELSEAIFTATDGLHGQGSLHRPMATDGLHDLVEALGQAAVACAVISNDDSAGIEAFLASQDLSARFQGFWSADHAPRKPEPAAVHALCDVLGVAVQRCALIGDANSDLRMARQAGVPVVLGYGGGWSSAPPLDSSFPCLSHWNELKVRTTAA